MVSYKKLLAAVLSIALCHISLQAFAGEQYIDSSRFAISGYDTVAYFDLQQNPVGEAQAQAIPGKASITAQYNGATWAFSTVENRDRFLADPEKYAPLFNGHCAYGTAQGGKVPANPHLWRIVDGRLYLNINKRVVGFWEEDIAGNIDKANNNWPGIEPRPAATNPVPDFDGGAAPVK